MGEMDRWGDRYLFQQSINIIQLYVNNTSHKININNK